MDPQATLDAIRQLAKEIIANDTDESDEAMELAEYVEELDKWLLKGGLLPEDWDNDAA